MPLSAAELESLAQTYGTPFQLYDEEAIRQNVRHLVGSFRAHFPEFQQFFAVKARDAQWGYVSPFFLETV